MEGVPSARLEFRLQSEVRFRQYKLRETSVFQLNVCENKLKMSVNILLISSVLTFLRQHNIANSQKKLD